MPGFISDLRTIFLDNTRTSCCVLTIVPMVAVILNMHFITRLKMSITKIMLFSNNIKNSNNKNNNDNNTIFQTDPHIHPSMAAVILNMHFITPFDWRMPGFFWMEINREGG